MILEVCVDSIESAINAVEGGADRLEICSSLSEGGLTPTPAFVRAIKECLKFKQIPLFCMVRPRGGPMQFSTIERAIILGDVEDLKAAGADGFVFGALTAEGNIDIDLCKAFLQAVGDKPCTFHRAFDLCVNPFSQLEVVSSLGFKRLLTSGSCSTAIDGIPLIEKLVERSEGRIIIMAGAGINSSNYMQLIKATGVKEIHASAKYKKILPLHRARIGMADDTMYVTSTLEVQGMRNALDSFAQ